MRQSKEFTMIPIKQDLSTARKMKKTLIEIPRKKKVTPKMCTMGSSRLCPRIQRRSNVMAEESCSTRKVILRT